MNDHEILTNESSSTQQTGPDPVADEARSPALWGDYEEAELLARLRSAGELDAESRALLEAGLADQKDAVRLWFLLSSLEHVPARSIATEMVFQALCRLIKSSSPVIRLSAYRWLAGLYRIDLRFENRAKLTLRDCRSHENGPMLKRLEYFLSTC
ncbi:MAG: hypothetical protein ACE37N_07295 [Pseudohongiellaceae bacterium]